MDNAINVMFEGCVPILNGSEPMPSKSKRSSRRRYISSSSSDERSMLVLDKTLYHATKQNNERAQATAIQNQIDSRAVVDKKFARKMAFDWVFPNGLNSSKYVKTPLTPIIEKSENMYMMISNSENEDDDHGESETYWEGEKLESKYPTYEPKTDVEKCENELTTQTGKVMTSRRLKRREKKEQEKIKRLKQSERDKELRSKIAKEKERKIEEDVKKTEIRQMNKMMVKEAIKLKQKQKKIMQEVQSENKEENEDDFQEINVKTLRQQFESTDEEHDETNSSNEFSSTRKRKKKKKKQAKNLNAQKFCNVFWVLVRLLTVVIISATAILSVGEYFVKYVGMGFTAQNQPAGIINMHNRENISLCFMARRGKGANSIIQDRLRIIDSGASYHVSGEEHIWVGSRRRLKTPKSLAGFDAEAPHAKSLRAYEVGTIAIPATVKGKPTIIKVKNVLYIPEMGNVTLVSESMLDSLGHRFTTAGGVVSCYNKRGVMKWNAFRKDGLYSFEDPVKRCMMSKDEAHAKFGHVNENVLNQIGDFSGELSP